MEFADSWLWLIFAGAGLLLIIMDFVVGVGDLLFMGSVFIIGGLREFGEPARKALIMDLAARDGLGRQIGAYYMVRGVSVIAAPLIGGVLWDSNHVAPFLVGGIISSLGVLWFALEGFLFRPKSGQAGLVRPGAGDTGRGKTRPGTRTRS